MLFIIRMLLCFVTTLVGTFRNIFFNFYQVLFLRFEKLHKPFFSPCQIVRCHFVLLMSLGFSSLANPNTLPRAIPLDDRPLSSKKMEVLSINSACLWFQKVIPNRFDTFSISKSHIFRKNEEIILNSKSHCLSIP